MDILYTEERVSTACLVERVFDDVTSSQSPQRLNFQRRREKQKNKTNQLRHGTLVSNSPLQLPSLICDHPLPQLQSEQGIIKKHLATFNQNGSVSFIEISAETDDIQKEFLLSTPSLKEIVGKVFFLHGSLQAMIEKAKAKEDSDFLEAVTEIESSNNMYIKLFEQLLSVLLSLQRQKFSKKVSSHRACAGTANHSSSSSCGALLQMYSHSVLPSSIKYTPSPSNTSDETARVLGS
jgi:hypothetical protein